MATVVINNTVRISATFTTGPSPIPSDPTSVTVSILSTGNTTVFASPVRDGVGTYHYDWTPLVAGQFTIRFDATWVAGPDTIIDTNLAVIPSSGPFATVSALSLGSDYSFTFLIDPQPLFLDPEEFVGMFPDAPLSQIAEFDYIFSSESQSLLGNAVITPIVQQEIYDYVQAATACALTRIYDITGGADESLVTLGDLTIQTKRQIKDNVDRANATTWCELASVIRNELYAIASKGGMKAVLKGSKYFNPIPQRYIQHVEWRDWSPYSGQ